MFVHDIISITDLPRGCIEDCSGSGDVTESVQFWREKLEFTADRENAERCLQGYGAWDDGDLREEDDDTLAERILWLACGYFSEYITEAEDWGFDPFGDRPPGFEPRIGSDIFCLEG